MVIYYENTNTIESIQVFLQGSTWRRSRSILVSPDSSHSLLYHIRGHRNEGTNGRRFSRIS